MRTFALAFLAAAAFGQYKLEPAGAPPSELAPAIAAQISANGHRVLAPDGKPWCEVWFVKQAPSGGAGDEAEVTWKTVPHGALIGAIRFPGNGADRRGQSIKPGVYTLRFSYYPVNGDHQGVAPQRDFLILSPAALDQDAQAVGSFDALMNMTRKASNTPHPAVLSMWMVESDFKPGLEQMGDHDWVLKASVGEAHIALIVVGRAEG